MKALYVLRLSFICAYGDIEHKTKQHNEHSHLFFVCVLWDDCKRWYNHMWHNASFIASNTLRKERERELPHIQKLACYVCLSTKIYDNQSQHLTSLFQLLFAHKMQTLFCRVNKKNHEEIFILQNWIKFIKYLLFTLITTLSCLAFSF